MRMPISNLLPLSLLSCFLLFGCIGDVDQPSPHVITGNTYTDRDLGYSFSLPSGWQNYVDYTIQSVKVDVITAAAPVLGFSANVIAMRSLKQAGQSLQARLIQEVSDLHAQFPAAIVIDSGVGTRSGGEVARIVFTRDNNGANIKQKLLLFERKTTVVGLTFTDLTSGFDGNAGFLLVDSTLLLD